MPVISSVEVTFAASVLETTQTSGTGAYALDGVSVEGMQSFISKIGDGNSTTYKVKRASTWERGIGAVSAGAPVTISRDVILETSAGTLDPIDWPTNDPKEIWCDFPPELANQIDPDVLAFLGEANVFTGVLTIDVDADDIDVLILKNAAGTEVFRGRVNSSGNGALVLRNAAAATKVVITGGTNDGQIELTGTDGNPAVQLNVTGVHAVQGDLTQAGKKAWSASTLFASAEQSITSGATVEVAHGLGAVPSHFWAVLRCKTTNLNWAVDDELIVAAGRSTDADEGLQVFANATNVGCVVGENGVNVFNKSTGVFSSITQGSWRVILKAVP